MICLIIFDQKSKISNSTPDASPLPNYQQEIMPKQALITSNAPPPGGAYSQGLRVGKLIFVAGQLLSSLIEIDVIAVVD
jgi:hypothetical protein